MRQQINLFRTLTQPSKYHLSERFMFKLMMGFVGLLLLITLIQVVSLQYGKIRVKSLEKVYLADQDKFKEDSRLSGIMSVSMLTDEIQRKTLQLQMIQQRKVTYGNCSMMSQYLLALGHMQVGGLWLSQIFIDLVNDKISLSGMTYSPVLLMQLVQSLNETECFASQDFGPIKLNRQEKESNKLLQFIISSQQASVSTGNKV